MALELESDAKGQEGLGDGAADYAKMGEILESAPALSPEAQAEQDALRATVAERADQLLKGDMATISVYGVEKDDSLVSDVVYQASGVQRPQEWKYGATPVYHDNRDLNVAVNMVDTGKGYTIREERTKRPLSHGGQNERTYTRISLVKLATEDKAPVADQSEQTTWDKPIL